MLFLRKLSQPILYLFPFFSGVVGTVSKPYFTAYEMKIGAITFQVATGDITTEQVDVIVNSTTRTFNLKSGTLFKQYIVIISMTNFWKGNCG